MSSCEKAPLQPKGVAQPSAQAEESLERELLFGDWQSKAELQVFMESLEPGKFFAAIEGNYDNGLHKYRAVVQPFTDQRYEMWATYWGLSEEQFYETELMLLRKGFQKQHLQVYRDEAKRSFYQMVYVRPIGSPLRGNALIEDEAEVEDEQFVSNGQNQDSSSQIITPVPDLEAETPVDDPPPPPPVPADVQTPVNKIYTVVPGDTLSHISRKYKVPVASIKTENNLRSDMLRVGQKLKIPAGN